MQNLQNLVDEALTEFEKLEIDPAGLATEAIQHKKTVLRKCLVEAVKYIERGQTTEAVQALSALGSIRNAKYPEFYAKEITDIYNNIACAYKASGQVHSARKYLEIAKEYLPCLPDEDKASLHLNFCAIYSSLGNHDLAYSYGRKAMLLAQESILNLGKDTDTSHLVTLLAASYHNLGVEEEFRKNLEAAEELYQKAVKLLDQSGGFSKHLRDNCTKSLAGVRKKNLISRPASARLLKSSEATCRSYERRSSLAKLNAVSARSSRPLTSKRPTSAVSNSSIGLKPRSLRITSRPLRTTRPASISEVKHSKKKSGISKSIETAAALVIQKTVKHWLYKRKAINEMNFVKALPNAVTQIQSAFRGWQLRSTYSTFTRHDIGFSELQSGRTWLNGELYAYKISQNQTETKVAVLNTERPEVNTCLINLPTAKPSLIISGLSLCDGRLHFEAKQSEVDEQLKAAVMKIEQAYLKHKKIPQQRSSAEKNLLSKSQSRTLSKSFRSPNCSFTIIQKSNSLLLKVDSPGLEVIELSPYLQYANERLIINVLQRNLKVVKDQIITGLPDLGLIQKILKLVAIPKVPLKYLAIMHAVAKIEMKHVSAFINRLTAPQFNRKNFDKSVGLRQLTDKLRQLQSLIRGVLVRKKADFLMPLSTEIIVYKGSYMLNGRMLAIKVLRKFSKLKFELEWSYHRRLIYIDLELISHLENPLSEIIENSVLPCLRYDPDSDCYYLEQSLLQSPEVFVTEVVRPNR